MKKVKKVLVSILVGLFLIATLPTMLLNVSAASNPYPSSQTIGGVTTVPCTRYAWQQAYDRLGIALPNWGNAINWLDRAANAGYSTGSTAQANAIAVWKSSAHSYGHVSFVISVSGNYMFVNEGGMNDSNGNAANGTGIITNSKVSSIVGTKKSSYSSCTLLGFIYLSNVPSTSIKISSESSKNTITDTNAILWGRVDKPSSSAVSKIGIKIRRGNSTYENGWSKFETPSKNYVGSTFMQPYFNMNTELHITLLHVTKYYYTFYATVDGKEYSSPEYSFTTTGSHSYGSWTTTKTATCTLNGTKQRKCYCGNVETGTISALGHSYESSWTTDVSATCTQTGSKSKHCTRCGSKGEVTTIAKTAHKYGAWETVSTPKCTTAGLRQRKCSCGDIQKESIAALGHNYSASWTVDKQASCGTNGEKSQHCSNCNAKTNITVIKALGHSWDAWKTIKESTTTEKGVAERNCKNCSEKEQKTIAKLAKDGHTHNFGEWSTVTKPTCSVDGKEDRKCTICSESEERMIVATGHKYDDFTIITPATETEVGKQTKTCSVCGEVVEEEIPMIVHETAENRPSDAENTKGDDSGKTNGWLPWVIIAAAVVLICGGAVIFIVIKKKKE